MNKGNYDGNRDHSNGNRTEAVPMETEVTSNGTAAVPIRTEVISIGKEVVPIISEAASMAIRFFPMRTEIVLIRTEVVPWKTKIIPMRTWVTQSEQSSLRREQRKCGKFRGFHAIVAVAGLVSSCCCALVRSKFSCVYFMGPEVFLVCILWVQNVFS